MSRIFLSHSSADEWSALALRQWLTRNGWDDVFLDIDPARGLIAGQRWQEALRRAADQCEAVVFLVSPDWAKSKWCLAEFLLAKTLHKLIFGVIVKDVPIDELPTEMTSEWQLCRLVGSNDVETFPVSQDGRAETVGFSSEGLSRLRVGLQQAGLSAEHFTWPPPHDEHRSPYRGLEALDLRDAAVFFGRDAEIIHGLDQLRGLRAESDGGAFVILGPSGTGKSSFLRAGLLPRLARNDRHFFPLRVISPERGPLFGEAGLARAIAEANVSLGLLPTSVGDIKERMKTDVTFASTLLMNLRAAFVRSVASSDIQSPPTIVLAVDQAEQLFDAGIRAESHSFLQYVGAILRSDVSSPQPESRARFIVIFTIRSDRYEPLQTAPELAGVRSVIFDRLRPMSPAQFKEVINGPATRTIAKGRRVTFEPDLVNTLLAESAKGADTLPLLSLTLHRLYEDYASHGTVRLKHYEATGGLSDIIQHEIQSVLASDASERGVQLDSLHALFIPWLVTVNSDDEPLARVARASDLPDESAPLVEALVRRRLLVRDRRGTDHVVQVAHESLLRHWEALQQWIREDKEDLREIDRLEQAAVAWTRNGKKPGWLMSGEQLRTVEALYKSPRYVTRLRAVHDFLSESRRTVRRARVLRLATSAAVVVGLAFGVWRISGTQNDGTPAPLRSTASEVEEAGLGARIRALGMFERTRNPEGVGYENDFRTAQLKGAHLIVDHASSLTWQREGSSEALGASAAGEYIEYLNRSLYAGFGDWRLPTLEEALSLIESRQRADGLYIHESFDRTQSILWTTDQDGSGEWWSVDLQNAAVSPGVSNFAKAGVAFIRAVRSGVDQFTQIDISVIANSPWSETGLFYKEPSKPPRGMTRGGVSFWLADGPRAVLLSAANGSNRPTEAKVDVTIPDAVAAHVLLTAGWLTEVYRDVKVGEIEYHLNDRVVRTDLIGWRTVREGWNSFEEEILPSGLGTVALTNFYKEKQYRSLTAGKDPALGLGIIDMLSTDFGDIGVGRRLTRIVIRDTSQPKSWRDPRDQKIYEIDPNLAIMGITVRSRSPK